MCLHKCVYKIPFACDKVYIGDTRRTFQTRIKQNCIDILQNMHKKSTLAEHSNNIRNPIEIERIEILSRIDNM